jgi:hypothetical protein
MNGWLSNCDHVNEIKICPLTELIKHYAMKIYGGVDVQIEVFLISEVVEVSGQFQALATLPLRERDSWAPEPVCILSGYTMQSFISP